MEKKRKLTHDTESHLQNLNIRHKGFERYESADVLIEGQSDNPEYRWRITFKHTGRTGGAVSLADALQQIKRAIDPNLGNRTAGPKLTMGMRPSSVPTRKKKAVAEQQDLDI